MQETEVHELGAEYLTDTRERFRKMKDTAETAVAQVDNESLFASPVKEVNSIAVTMKHMAGNLKSRFSDFLTSDGEKPDRNRDAEFEITADESREWIMRHWNDGWSVLFTTLESLAPADLLTAVRIGGEPHTVLQALNRQIAHQSYHVGQMVLLAKYYVQGEWKTLSIPRNGPAEFSGRMLDANRG